MVLLLIKTGVSDSNEVKNGSEILAMYLHSRGWNLVSTTSALNTTKNVLRGVAMIKDFSKSSIQSNCLNFNHSLNGIDIEEAIIFLTDNKEHVSLALKHFKSVQRKEKMLFLQDDISQMDVANKVEKQNIKLDMAQIQENGSLLIATLVMTARFQNPVVNERIFLSYSGPEEEPIFNLKGEMITGITLPFPPYFTVDDCTKSNGTGCEKKSGFLVAVEQQLSNVLNFSFDNILEPTGNWGLQPLNGDFKTGQFEGTDGWHMLF